MKIVSFLVLLTFQLSHLSSEAAFSYPQKEETMARVQRLLMASVMELPAEQWLADMQATGYQDLPAYKKFLEEEDLPYDKYTYNILMPFVCKIDGSNMRSTGDADILRLTREFLTVKSTNPDWQSAAYCLLYLSQKGVGEDLPLLEKYSTLPSKLPIEKQSALDSRNILKARVSGTNVMTGLRTQYYCWSTNEPPFLPSIANTGPQAAYVYDLLKQALAKYGDVTNIPPELLTMVVSFGADGRPVCNVDLAKYGLVMPDFPLPPPPAVANKPTMTEPQKPANVSKETDAPHVAETPANPPVWKRSVVPLAVGAGVFAALFLWRGLRKRKP